MANNFSSVLSQVTFIEQLRPFVVDDDAYGRICADLHDLAEASAWLLQTLDRNRGRNLSPSELEDLLVEIEIHFVEHTLFHLDTFKQDIKATLENFPGSNE